MAASFFKDAVLSLFRFYIKNENIRTLSAARRNKLADLINIMNISDNLITEDYKTDVLITDISAADEKACAEIYNYYINNTVVTLEETPLSPAEFSARVKRIKADYPYIVAKRGDEVLGYAYLDKFNPRSAYRITADLSIYVDKDHRGEHIGSMLYAEIEKRAREMKTENIVSLVTGENESSIAFHLSRGFLISGKLEKAAFKFGGYRDLVYLIKHL